MRILQVVLREYCDLMGTQPRHRHGCLHGGYLCLVLSFGAGLEVRGQNLVPNPGFENFTTCPNSAAQINFAAPWSTPTTGSPDYFHGCQTTPNSFGVPANSFGNEAPNSGLGYAGIRIYTPAPHDNYREYLEIQLTSPLVAGHVYEVSFYASLADIFRYGIENLDAYLSVGSVGPLATSVNLPFTPQVTNPTGIITNKSGWRQISGMYTASGLEDHLVIGNFRNDASTINQNVGGICCSYYFIDDVSVTDTCEPPDPACHSLLNPSCPNADLLIPIDGGVPDDFCLPTEPATPVGGHPSCATGKPFDDLTINKFVCHTITGLPSGIGAAVLEVRLMAGSSSGVFNDSIGLQWVSGATYEWSRRIGSDASIPVTGLRNAPWAQGDTESFCLDLSALPNEAGSPSGPTTDIIPDLNATGRLDFLVQDDSAVDYIRLWLAQCPCEPLPDGSDCTNTCRDPNGTCKPTEYVHPVSGQPIVTKCDCVHADECSVEVASNHGLFFFFCDGVDCPVTSQPCQLTSTPNANNTTTIECCAPCSQPPEACCAPFFQCHDDDPLCCRQQGGDPAGPGTSCTGPEECCYPNGSNQIQDPACCNTSGGTPQGPGTGNVSLAPGACCLPVGSLLGTCVVINPYCCADLGGNFLGPFSDCLGDQNGDGIDDACAPPTCPLPLPFVQDICAPRLLLGDCQDLGPKDFCRPTQLKYDPTTQSYTAEKCACVNEIECYIDFRDDVIPPVPFCAGQQCPGTNSPCEQTTTQNPDGTITYDCCQETPCEPNMAHTACEGSCDTGENCRPRCMRKNLSTGQTLVQECTCRDDDSCHAVAGFELPTCEGQCPPDQTCLSTRTNFTDPHTGNSYVDVCCDCESVCSPPEPPSPGDLCTYAQSHTTECVGGGPDDTCLPRSVDIFGNQVLNKQYPVATECTCGPCGLIPTWGIWPTTGLPYVSALSCGGDCTPPDQGACRLFKNGIPIGSNITVLLSSLDILDTLRCDCEPVTPRCAPNALGTACEGSCPSANCLPTELTCVGHHCTITECDCVADTACHVELVPGTTQPVCSGRCPPPLGCARMLIENIDGSVSHSCQCEGAPPCDDDFADSFEPYALGAICGQGGWEEWIESTDVCGAVTSEQAADGLKSVKIVGNVGGSTGLGDDIVHRLNASGGSWTFRIMAFVPVGATGIAYVNLLNTYDDPPDAPPATFRWSVEVRLDANTNSVTATGVSEGRPLVRGRWAELRVEVDLDHDSVDSFYDGVQFVSNRSWINGASTGGRPLIQALDLYAGEPKFSGTSGMHFDAISLSRSGADCNHNRVSDECDIANGFSPDANETRIPDECESWGDFNGDGDTDLTDFAQLFSCLRGPGRGGSTGCEVEDLNHDLDIDLRDVSRFQNFFTGR